MNYAVWAEDINNPQARILKARYYDEISYVDDCLGRILDAVEKARGRQQHADLFHQLITATCWGDHHGWQKECYFEGACHIPFLVSWPARIRPNNGGTIWCALTDLFGIATHAADQTQAMREGIDVLGVIKGESGYLL